MNFYVYVIFRHSGQPCYVGKGTGGRWKDHIRDARNPHLRNIYKLAEGDLPIVKVRKHLSENDAFNLEKSLIQAIGREAAGGPLVNLTDGGDGPSGYKHRLDTLVFMSALSKERMADLRYRDRVVEAQNVARATHEYRTRRSLISKEVTSRPGHREMMREATLAAYAANPSLRAKVSETTKSAMCTEKVRLKVSEAQKRRFQNPEEREKLRQQALGRKHSEETKAKMAASHRGQKRTLEQRAKMSAWQVGRKMSDEAKAKMSAAAKRRSQTPEGQAHMTTVAKKGSDARWRDY